MACGYVKVHPLTRRPTFLFLEILGMFLFALILFRMILQQIDFWFCFSMANGNVCVAFDAGT